MASAVPLCLAFFPSSAVAQTFSVERISSPAASLGKVISATSGDTVFSIDSATGDVTRDRGSAFRMNSSPARATITISCSKGGKDDLCGTTGALVQVGSIGAATGRARALKNLAVSAGTAAMAAPKKGGDPLSFTVGPMGESSRTFYLGADFTVAGNESGLETGLAAAEFYVTISRPDGTGSYTANGRIDATILRSLDLVADSQLNFGTVTLPSAGTGLVKIDAATGTRTFQGQGVRGLPSTTPTRGAFTVNGEGGQAFSVSIPPTFEMRTSGGTVIVTTSHTATGPLSLSGRLGSPGTASFYIGGSFPITPQTRPGSYTGTYTVSVQYN